MKRQQFTLLAAMTLFLCASTAALAHGSFGPRVSFSFGTSMRTPNVHSHHHRHWPGNHQFGPTITYGPQWSYAPPPVVLPYVYSSQVIVRAPTPAPVYIEQAQPAVAPALTLEAGYWYYCGASNAYYPYVRECAEAWQKVAPSPSSASVR